MLKLMSVVALAAMTTVANAAVLNFEGATSSSDIGTTDFVNDNFGVLSDPCTTYAGATGYCFGGTDGPAVAYNGFGTAATLTSTIGEFDLQGFYATAAFVDGQSFLFEGLLGGSVVFSDTRSLSNTTPAWIALNFSGIDAFRVSAVGAPTWIAIDEFTYSAVSGVPLPASLPLALAGAGALAFVSRRRA